MRIKLSKKYVTLEKGDYIMDDYCCLQIFTTSYEAKVHKGCVCNNPKLSKKEFKRFLKDAVYKKRHFSCYLKTGYDAYIYIKDKDGRNE